MNDKLFRRAAIALALASVTTIALAQSDGPLPGGRLFGGPSEQGQRRGPPFDKIARDLGIPVDRVRAAFEEVGPPPRGQGGPPSEEQMAQHAQKLASALNVPVEKLRPVLEKYRPPQPPHQ